MGNSPIAQYEVDDLLNGLDGENGVASERFPRLEIICDRFARYATTSLSSLFLTRIELNPITIKIQPFGEIMRSLPVPTSISILDTSHVFAGRIIDVIDSRLVFSFVESAFGQWASSRPKIEGREFTSIEQGVIYLAHQELIHSMNKAWQEFIVNISFSRGKWEINPQFASIVDPSEPCLKIFYEVELDVNLGAIIHVIPISSIKPFYNLLKEYPDNIRLLTCSAEKLVEIVTQRKEEKQSRAIRSNKEWLDIVNAISPKVLAHNLRNEHPQTLACIFSFMKPAIAAQNLLYFPAGIRSEIIIRMERLHIKNTVFLELLEDIFHNYIKTPPELINIGKGKQVLNALSIVSPETKQEIEEEIREDLPVFFNEDY